MTDDGPRRPTLAVVGGGITGLTAAHAARRAVPGLRVVVLEAEDRPGGKVVTDRADGFLVEGGPDGFVAAKGEVLALAEELGLAEAVIPTRPQQTGPSVWWDGRLHPVPAGLLLMVPARLGPVLRSSLLSTRGKLRLLAEPLVPPDRSGADQSLERFVTRRLGREVLERIAEPLVAGIHAAEPATMSLRASFPRFLEMEREHGSLLRAARRAATRPADGDRFPSHFASFREGMGSLVDALVAGLDPGSLRLGRRVASLITGSERFGVVPEGGEPLEADAVVLALPAATAARLLAGPAPKAAEAIGEIRQVTTVGVTLAYRRSDVPPLEGHGFLVPAAAGRRLSGVSFLSQKWEGRVPDDRSWLLMRAFLARHLAEKDADLEAVVREELAEMLGVRARPALSWIHRWRAGLHGYTLGHHERVARAEGSLPAGLSLAGAAFHGVGLNECVADGRRAGTEAARTAAGRA